MAEQLITRTGRLNPVRDVVSVTEQAQSTQELQELSNKFGELGDVLRQKKVQSDLITAKIAFEMEKQMPGGLEPEAEVAFGNMTAENAANKFITEFTIDNDVRSSLILQNPEGDSPSQMQELYERQVGDGISKFLTNTGLNNLQIAHVAPLLDKYKNVAINQFTSTLAKQISDTKTAEGNEVIKGAIENQIVFHVESESIGQESDLKELFTVKWHQQLKFRIMEALPYFTKDEVDNLIVDNLSLIASDPDAPRPDILEYLDKPQKGDRIRFSSIKGLGKKIAAAQKQARQMLIKTEKIRASQETKIAKQREDDAEHGGADWVTSQFEENTPASKDLNLLQRELERLFPNMKESVVRSMIGNAEKRLVSKASSLSSQANSASLSADIDEGDFATFQDVTADPRYSELGGKQYEDIFRKFNEWKKGVISQGSTVSTRQRGMLRQTLEANVIAKFDLTQINKHINKLTGGLLSLPMEDLIRINNIVSLYDAEAANIIRNFSDDPTKIDDALIKLRLDMLTGRGVDSTTAEDLGLNVEKKPEREERLSATGQAPQQFLEELGEGQIAEEKVETIKRPGGGVTSSEISKGNESFLPIQPDPMVHVRPASQELKVEIKRSIETLQKPKEFDPNIDITARTPIPFSNVPELNAAIDTIKDAGQALSKSVGEAPEVLQKGVERALDSLSNLGTQISEPLGKAIEDLKQGILRHVIQPAVTFGVTEAGGFVPEGSDLGDNTETEATDIIQPNAFPSGFDDPNTPFNERLLEDTRAFTKGGEGAAGPDPRIAGFKADREKKAREESVSATGLAPQELLKGLGEGQIVAEKALKKKLSSKLKKRPKKDSATAQILADEAPSSIKTFTVFDEGAGKKTVPTIGFGFNLDKLGAQKQIEALGLDFAKVKSGKQSITREQAEILAIQDIATARGDAIKFIGSGIFKGLSKKRQDVLVNLAYQMGLPTLKLFTKLRDAIIAGDFDRAGAELIAGSKDKKTGNVGLSSLVRQTPARTVRRAQELIGGK